MILASDLSKYIERTYGSAESIIIRDRRTEEGLRKWNHDGSLPTIGDCLPEAIMCLETALEESGEEASNEDVLSAAQEEARRRLYWLFHEEEDDDGHDDDGDYDDDGEGGGGDDAVTSVRESRPVETGHARPVVTGPVDGNILSIMGAAAGALRRNGQKDRATEMIEHVKKSGSYENALGVIEE